MNCCHVVVIPNLVNIENYMEIFEYRGYNCIRRMSLLLEELLEKKNKYITLRKYIKNILKKEN